MKIAWACCLMLLSVGCAHTVNYKLTEADRWSGARIDKVVRVQTLVDQTPDPEMIERPAMSDLHRPATLVETRTLQEGDYTWRLNYRSSYSNKEIANGVTKMIVKHLKHARIFRDVVDSSSKTPADYELTGNIAVFHAEGRVNKGAEGAMTTGSQFGLIGALVTSGATAGQKTEIRAGIELRDVSLTDITQHQPLWTDTISISTNFVAPFEAASESMIFVHADNCLKQAVTELVQRLAAYVSSASAK